MRRLVALSAVLACGVAATAVYAMYSVSNHGEWPESWPAELEPLRAQARTLEGPLAPQSHHEIPFTDREQFEAAWPHILKVKSPGAPLVLRRSPDAATGMKLAAGVRIHCPPRLSEGTPVPPSPLPGDPNEPSRWLYTTYVELVVDGEVVDLNRIPLPLDTPILDQRFEQPEEATP